MIIDSVLTGWFTLEFLLRVFFSPSKIQFTLKLQNWIDLFVLIPLYLMLAFERSLIIDILNTLRVIRIFRCFKLLYDLQILTKTVKASRQHLMILLFILIIPVIVFSSLVLYSETTWGSPASKKKFHNIPNSVWWGIITMTTVGYGDMVPASVVGKIIGGIASICGVIILSTSASVVGSTFSLYYNLAQAQMKIPKKRRKIDVEFQSLPTVLACRSSQADSTVTSSDSGYQKSPNRLQICDRNSFAFEGNNGQAANKLPCMCTCTKETSSSVAIPMTHMPTSPRPPLTRKASIRRESILV